MKELINNIGTNNIYIIILIIAVIIVALIIIIIIENHSNKKSDEEYNYYEIEKEKKSKKKNKKLKEEVLIEEPTYLESEDESKENILSEEKSISVDNEKEHAKLEAKRAIEEAAKKMVYEDKNNLEGPTFFEKIQEESSIISYDELKNSSINVDETNDNLLNDEGNEPITMDELYNNHLNVQEKNDYDDHLYEDNKIVSLNEELTEKEKEKKEDLKEDSLISLNKINIKDRNIYSSDKNFKSSDVISPVYGVKKEIIYQKEYNELGETINIKELEVEIKKTEEFLKELKKLKGKLE